MKLLQISLWLIAFACLASASPLVFKISKEIDSTDKPIELFTLDTSKFKELRILIRSTEPQFGVSVRAIDDTDDLYLIGHTIDLDFYDNLLIPTPPAKIAVKIRGKGTFKAYVWAS